MDKSIVVKSEPTEDTNGQTTAVSREMDKSIVIKSEPTEDTNGQTTAVSREVPLEIFRDDTVTPARLRIKDFDDDDEETVAMTVEQMQNYIVSKAESYLKDPEHNPYVALKNHIITVNDRIQGQDEEIRKLQRMFDGMYRDQVRFLRHTGAMPKVDTRTVAVSVDLPWLPDSVSTAINEDMLKKSNKSRVFLNSPETASKNSKKSKEPIECIDLTDDDPDVSHSTSHPIESKANIAANSSTSNAVSSSVPSSSIQTIVLTPITKPLQHPAPLPKVPEGRDESEVPPKPRVKISVDKIGIVLQWDLPPEARHLKIMGFEIFGYQEKNNVPISSALWKKIGSVDLMPLPMSCTLTHFVEGFKYHFSIRAFCKDDNYGHFSDPASIMFMPEIGS